MCLMRYQQVFENSNIYFGLVNPTRIKTKMVAHLHKDNNFVYLEPDTLAGHIINFINDLNCSSFIDINT